MKMNKTEFSTVEKIRMYRNLFAGLPHVYGTYDPQTGRVRQVKEPVTDAVIYDHLSGRQPYGVYLLVGNTIKALAVDFDEDDLSLPVAFMTGAKEYRIPAYIERSKSKGYHVWVFFDRFVSAWKARLVAGHILTNMGKPDTEIFPKQDALGPGTAYGNFINAPLFGAWVAKGRTVFVDPDDPVYPHPNQWKLLKNVQRVCEYQLGTVIEEHHLLDHSPVGPCKQTQCSSDLDPIVSSSGLLPCGQRMLAMGVTAYQRVCCFRLAIQLKRTGLPCDLAVEVLKAWARKNRPAAGKQIMTDAEVHQQTRSAYAKPYRSIGCEDPAIAPFCHPNCPLKTHKTNHIGDPKHADTDRKIPTQSQPGSP